MSFTTTRRARAMTVRLTRVDRGTKGDDWKFVEAPAFNGGVKASARKSEGSANSGTAKKRTSK